MSTLDWIVIIGYFVAVAGLGVPPFNVKSGVFTRPEFLERRSRRAHGRI